MEIFHFINNFGAIYEERFKQQTSNNSSKMHTGYRVQPLLKANIVLTHKIARKNSKKLHKIFESIKTLGQSANIFLSRKLQTFPL